MVALGEGNGNRRDLKDNLLAIATHIKSTSNPARTFLNKLNISEYAE